MLEIAPQISDTVLTKIMKVTDNNELKHSSYFMKCVAKITSGIDDSDEALFPPKIFSCGIFFITSEAIHVSTDFHWICENISNNNNNKNENSSVTLTQPMTNLIELQKVTQTSFELNFMDDSEKTVEKWTFTYDSYARIAELLEILDKIWKKVFGMKLITESSYLIN
jgi:hypothetical protein